jgi:hypothetical protein
MDGWMDGCWMKISLINVFFENQSPCHIREKFLKFPYLKIRFQLGVSCQNIVDSIKNYTLFFYL